MSTAPAARYSFVAADPMVEASPNIDYDAGSEMDNVHDEVPLVNAFGRPCGIVVGDRHGNVDSHYTYLNGDRASVRDSYGDHELTIRCSHLPAAVRRKLDMWMQRRTPVMFSPGFGSHSEFAYRPLRQLNDTNYDLTGRHVIKCASDSDLGFVWDDWNGRGAGVGLTSDPDKPRLVMLPYGGAGQVYASNYSNGATKGSPEYGDIGWGITGSGVTETLITGGFGQVNAPDSVRWQGDARDTDRTFMTGGTVPAGPGVWDAVVWIKGRTTQDAEVFAYNNMSDIDVVEIGGMDLGGWTPIRLRGTTYSGTSVLFAIRMNGTTGVNETFDIQVGAIRISGRTVGQYYSPLWLPWTKTYDTEQRDSDYVDSGNLEYPRCGTAFTSFWVPEWFDPDTWHDIGLCSYGSLYAGSIRIINYSASPYCRVAWRANESTNIAASFTPRLGAMNTIGISYNSSTATLYLNGEAAMTEVTGQYDVEMPTGETFYLGRGRSENCAWPFLMSQFRLEREQWDANRHADEHFTATDPFTIGGIVAARGREYEIVSVPSTKVLAGGGVTMWSGNIKLRQMQYRKYLSDITSCEGDYL